MVKFEENFHKIQSIQTPTLIIWGENDEVWFEFCRSLTIWIKFGKHFFNSKMLHVSGGQLLKDNIKNSKLSIIKNCNHVLQLDQPKETTRLLLDFLNHSNSIKDCKKVDWILMDKNAFSGHWIICFCKNIFVFINKFNLK